nr:uncharacterized mitochondrial protein AtMg00810-like [Tanacetum cinerariifolium]
MFAVCACARFQVTPKAPHLHAVKRIFRYLKGKPHLGLWYPKDSPFDLVAYSDNDYAVQAWRENLHLEAVNSLDLLCSGAMDSESIAGLWVAFSEMEFLQQLSYVTYMMVPSSQQIGFNSPCLTHKQELIHHEVAAEIEEQNDAEEQIQGDDNDAAQGADADVSGDDVQDQFIPSPAPPTPPPPPQDIPSTS